MTTSPVALEVRDLTTEIVLPEGTSKAVNGVSLSVRQGETLASSAKADRARR